MNWFEFSFAAKGHQFKRNGHVIPKFILFEIITKSVKYKEDKLYIERVLNGESGDYEIIDSEGWRDQRCFFNYEIHPVTGRPYKHPTLFETA